MIVLLVALVLLICAFGVVAVLQAAATLIGAIFAAVLVLLGASLVLVWYIGREDPCDQSSSSSGT